MNAERFKLKLKVYSPVHIGASADFEPTDFIIYSADNVASVIKCATNYIICAECGYKNPAGSKLCLGCDSELPESKPAEKAAEESSEPAYLYTFTPNQLLKSVSRQELLNCTKKNDLTVWQGFLKNNADKIVKNAHKRALVSSEISQKYSEKYGSVSSKDKDFNKFSLEKNISTSADDLPYIPGSSVKGAIRTALMSLQNTHQGLTYDDLETKNKGQEAEKILYHYNSVTSDPFKNLKIGDTETFPFLTRIGTAKNVKRNAEKDKITVDMEVIPAGTEFAAELTLCDCDNGSLFNMNAIAAACNKFYLRRLTTEKDKMVNIHHVSVVKPRFSVFTHASII